MLANAASRTITYHLSLTVSPPLLTQIIEYSEILSIVRSKDPFNPLPTTLCHPSLVTDSRHLFKLLQHDELVIPVPRIFFQGVN